MSAGAEGGAGAAASGAARLAPFVAMALAGVHREYPNRIGHLLRSDADVAPPRALTPAFYGCYDWHSAVHGHWLLARAARRFPEAPFAADARAALRQSLTEEKLAGEARYLESRPAFERPYGLAWLLQLHAELVTWPGDAEAATWATRLGPLVALAEAHLAAWLPKLAHPVRVGTHAQTAFSLGLALDWARATGSPRAALFEERARTLHGADRDLPLHLETSGEDFLSPSLGAADLLARVLSPDALAAWLDGALPTLPTEERADWLTPAEVPDRQDGRLAHLDGLNLSRAWMLGRLAAALPAADPRRPALEAAAAVHREAGLAPLLGELPYAGSHWLGTFAAYLLG